MLPFRKGISSYPAEVNDYHGQKWELESVF